ncbi:MAG: YggS family pyridoxal phosphate-dependent enzyme [Bacteroidia bacterium]
MSVSENIQQLKKELPLHVTLIAVSKTYPVEKIKEAYSAGQKIFGENKVQELCEKQTQLPSDIEWHLIGHLQSNKVKYIAPFVSLIQAVDSLTLLQEIDKQAQKNKRIINCLLQIYIAKEDTKFGLDFAEAEKIFFSDELKSLQNIQIIGLMGMATNTNNKAQIAKEFQSLKLFFDAHKNKNYPNCNLHTLSMGMSSDYLIAIEEGSTMIRVGSAIFGNRNALKK